MDERPRPKRRLAMIGQPCATSSRTKNARNADRGAGSSVAACHSTNPGPYAGEWHRTRSSKVPWGWGRAWRYAYRRDQEAERDEAPSLGPVSLANPPAGGRGVGTGVARPARDARVVPGVASTVFGQALARAGQTRRRPMDAPGMHQAAPARLLRGCLSETPQVSGGVGECAARDSNPEPAD
jgi:hypothetical protein